MKIFDSKYTIGAVALLAAQMAGAQLARAADYDVGSIHISQPWSRATPKGAASGAGYMTVTNKGTAPDRVSCVSSDASAQCQIHTMTMEDGVMKMRPVEGGLEILPGQSVKATLKFDHAGTVDVEYPIAGIGAPAPGAADAGGTMMSGDHGMQGSSGGMMMAPSGGGAMQGPSGSMQMNKP